MLKEENQLRADYEDDEEFENISLPEAKISGPPPRPAVDSWDEESPIQKKSEKRKETNMLQPLITYKRENLGEDFDETPWVPPSLILAEEFCKDNMFRSGRTKLKDICLTKAQDCGTGLPLYFQFLKSMIIALFFMTLFAIPSIIFNSQGTKITLSDRDSIGLYKLTLGNIGYSTDDSNYAKDSACTSGYGVSDNSTCIHVYGYQFTLTTAGEIITLFELFQITVFFLAVFYLSWRSEQVTQSTEGRDTVLSDYSIMIGGIPPNTTEKELVDHFSSLYQLKQKDWRKRPPLAEAEVVQQNDNSSLECLKGSWIGDVTIFRKVGRFLRAYKEEQKLMEELYRCRAFMKMYKEDTKYYTGPKPKQYAKYEKKMLIVGQKMDRITEKLLHRTVTSKVAPMKNQASKTASLSADAFAAFIVFNYTESKARCIEDYTVYSRFPWSLFYPKCLKFKGKRLVVTKAPEPDEIIWENLEIPVIAKYRYRTLTLLLSFALLIIGFVIILQAAINKESFNNELPDLTLCASDIPALYQGSYSLPSSIVMKRPTTGTDSYGMTRTQYDNNCSVLSSTAFYAVNTDGGDLSSPIGKYSISACSQALAKKHSPPYSYYGGCPHYNQTVFCPCVDVDGADTCYSLPCSNHDTSRVCNSFTSSNIAGCYCYSLLKETILSYFSISGALSVWTRVKNAFMGKSTSTSSVNPCRSFFIRYSTATILTYTAALATVVTNMLLKYIIVRTTKTEYWNSIDIEKGYIINKIFLVTYINMAFVVLLAFGYAESSPAVLKETQILQGSYIDFTPSWYGQVGTYLVITLLINIPSQYFLKIPRFILFKPFQRWREYPKIEKRSSKKMAMQHDVNMLSVGNVFDSTTNYAFLLANFFFCMTYAPGIPILTPIICAIFGIYFYLDKLLLCRYHQRPPHMSDGANKIILGLLPYAAIIRLAMGCWMFGNSDILTSDIANVGIIPGYSSADPAEANALYENYLADHSGDKSASFLVISKVARTNVLPLFIYLIVVLLVMLFRAFWRRLPFYWMWRFIAFVTSLICRKRNRIAEVTDEAGYVHAYDLQKLKDPLRMEMAPFTGNYFKYLKRNSEKPRQIDRLLGIDHTKLKSTELDDGWEVTTTPDDEFTIKVKKFTSATRVGNGVRSKGSEKKTYEVIRDNGCFSYALEDIPAYSIAVRAMAESADQQMSDLAGRTMVERFQNRKNIKVKQSKVKAVWQTNNVNDAKEKVRAAREMKKQVHADDYYNAGAIDPREVVSDYDDDDDGEEEEEEYD